VGISCRPSGSSGPAMPLPGRRNQLNRR